MVAVIRRLGDQGAVRRARSEAQYMTGKPVVASIKIAAVYVYTGSAVTALVYGTAATAGASAIFFVNNLASDFYDQMAAPPSGGDVHDRPPAIVTQAVPEVAMQAQPDGANTSGSAGAETLSGISCQIVDRRLRTARLVRYAGHAQSHFHPA